MDRFEIFRMQEPVPKDLLLKNLKIGNYREVVQEKDVLLRNCKARIRDLEQQIQDLEIKNKKLGTQVNSSTATLKEYELFYSKILSDSEKLVEEKSQLENKSEEMATFCKSIIEKYEKAKQVIKEYESSNIELQTKLKEYEEMINSLSEEYNQLKDYMQKKLGENEPKSDVKESFNLIRNQIQKKCSKSMFEPLKGLDK